MEVESDPSYVETYVLNNAATRAIIVGQAQGGLGAVAGQVAESFSGIANVTLHVLNASGVQIANTLTDSTGFYLVNNLPPGTVQIRMDTPSGYVPAIATKTGTMVAGSVTEIDFALSSNIAGINDLAARPKSGKIQLVWTHLPSADHSNNYRGTISGGPYLKIGTTRSTDSTYLESSVIVGPATVM